MGRAAAGRARARPPRLCPERDGGGRLIEAPGIVDVEPAQPGDVERRARGPWSASRCTPSREAAAAGAGSRRPAPAWRGTGRCRSRRTASSVLPIRRIAPSGAGLDLGGVVHVEQRVGEVAVDRERQRRRRRARSAGGRWRDRTDGRPWSADSRRRSPRRRPATEWPLGRVPVGDPHRLDREFGRAVARKASTRSASWPVTTVKPLAPPAAAARITCSISGTPATGVSGLEGEISRSRLPWPAAMIRQFIRRAPARRRR